MMSLLARSCILFILAATSASKDSSIQSKYVNAIDEEALMSPDEIIMKYGYTLETHKIPTRDGYILTAFRIPNGKIEETKPQTKLFREPVLINHGFMNSASEFLVVSSERALPFLLADAGYDVWLGNLRGSDYSLEHASLTAKDPKFWNFSMNEIGDYDVPSQIDYILQNSPAEKLSYIGFSMGAAVFFMTMSTYPEYNDKVRKMVALAPAAYMHMSTSALYPAPHSPDSAVLLHYDTWHGGEYLLQPRRTPMESAQMCADSPETCSVYLGAIGGYNSKHFNKTTTVRVSGHSPARASARTYVHFRQFVRQPLFARFDYGRSGNMAAYGTPTPPTFDLKRTTVPVFGLYGMNDLLVKAQAAKRQLSELSNWVNPDSAAVEDPLWSHLDFCYADAVKLFAYDKVLNFLKAN